MARPKDRAIEVSGPGRRADTIDGDVHPPSHRTTRILVLGALVLMVGSYALLHGFQRQSSDRSVDAYCRRVSSVIALDDALGNLDAKSSQEAFTQLEQLQQVAPTDIEPQLRIVVEASRPLVQSLQTSSADQEQALRQVLQSHQADMAAVDASAKAVEAYTSANCHRDLETSLPATTPSSVPATSTTAFAPAKPSTSSTVRAVPPPASTPR